MSGPLALEKYAALHAEMDAGKKPRDEVLKTADVTPEAWHATSEFWLGRMAQEAKRERFVLSQRYATLYSAHRRAIEEKKTRRRSVPAPPFEYPSIAQGQIAQPIPLAPQRSVDDAAAYQAAAAPYQAAASPSWAPGAATGVAQPGPRESAAPPPQAPSVAPPPRGVRQHDAPAPAYAPAAPAYAARLSVDQLAAMRAELAIAAEPEHGDVRSRFGLDDSTWPLEEAHWQKRFAADKSLFQTYVQRFQYFRALLRPRT